MVFDLRRNCCFIALCATAISVFALVFNNPPAVGGWDEWRLISMSGLAQVGQEVAPDELSPADTDATVVMSLEATTKQVNAVRVAMSSSAWVRRFAFVDPIGDAGSESPSVADPRRYFRVEFVRAEVDPAFTHRFETLGGVEGVISATTKRRAARIGECQSGIRRFDLEIFLDVSAKRTDRTRVRNALTRNREVEAFKFVSQRTALRYFRCVFAPEPVIRNGIEANDLPPSFWVRATPGANLSGLASQLEALPEITSVENLDREANPIPAV